MQSAQFQLHAQIEDQHWWFLGRRRIVRQLLGEVVSPDPASLVVDVGCGTGANIGALADAYRCVGIDTSAEAVQLAQRRFPNVEFRCGFAPADLGDVASQARAFLLMDVLEHVPDDFSLLSELLAAASPGAYFLVTVPADLRLWSEHDQSFGHYRRYDRRRFESVWQGLPVSTLLVSHFNARLYPLVRMVRAASRRRGHTSGLAGTDFKIPMAPVNAALAGIFAGETRTLLGKLRGEEPVGYQAGVSLVALLRREPGRITVRQKPAALAPDFFDPVAGAFNCAGQSV